MLGYGAVQQGALENFGRNLDQPSSYLDSLLRILSFDLGKSIDGVPVKSVLANSVLLSGTTFIAGLFVVVIIISAGMYFPKIIKTNYMQRALEFLAFLPGFVPAFLIFAFLVTINHLEFLNNGLTQKVFIGISSIVMPTAFSLVTILGVLQRESRMPYVRALRGLGASEAAVMNAIRRAAVIQVVGIFDKVIIQYLSVQIFAEIVFSAPGFGTVLLLSAQRTDVNMIIPLVIVISLVIVVSRILMELAINFLDPRDHIEI